jgi:MSHA biogenesis protein MshM
MYEAHFGLRELPFGLTPDTGFFLACESYQSALNTLLVAARSGEGFVKITGEVGTGKTMLCRKFLASLGDGFHTAYLPNPQLESRALMLALADELGVPARDREPHRLTQALQRRLLEIASRGRRTLLCIDEAQALPIETLESLRLLTNLETERMKLLQVVLFGQPELDRTLQDPSIRQLAQRIAFDYKLAPLTRDELDFYLAHRLSVAGFSRGRLFSPLAVRAMHHCSRGIPRLVNILAHKVLLLAYGKGGQSIGVRHVLAAARDTGSARSFLGQLARLLP